MPRFDRLVLAAVVLIAAPQALAHEVGLSQGAFSAADRGVTAELTFAAADAARLQHSDAALVTAHAGDAPCATEPAVIERTEDDGVRFTVRARCDDAPTRVTAAFLDALPRGHRHVATVADAAAVLHRAVPELALAGRERAPAVSAYLGLGVEHILIGLDHLAFLLALVLIGLRRRDALKIVTAFTVGHSVTLALAALGVVSLSGSIVEPIIAASIVWVGVENLAGARAHTRWRLAAPFGLVHGLGFAGVLAEIGLPAGDELAALVLFNAGVEVGQLLVLALVLPLLALARRARWFSDVGVHAASAGLIGLGALWFIERVLY